MIHLAGNSDAEITGRALEELTIYESEGVDGAIIEDYHGHPKDVTKVLEESSTGFKIIRGVNVLTNPYKAFELASACGAGFVQFDSVQKKHLYLAKYNTMRERFPDIAVLGGVRFKYTHSTGNSLEEDINDGKSRCEAIVTTGEGTGIETPIQKLKYFRKYLGNFPLIVGAGVTLENAYEQLSITDGAIIGSYFKPKKDTHAKVDRELVKEFMDRVRNIRDSN